MKRLRIGFLAAAGLIALSGWAPGTPLLDPMCGSGTIAIDLALAGSSSHCAASKPEFTPQYGCVRLPAKSLTSSLPGCANGCAAKAGAVAWSSTNRRHAWRTSAICARSSGARPVIPASCGEQGRLLQCLQQARRQSGMSAQ